MSYKATIRVCKRLHACLKLKARQERCTIPQVATNILIDGLRMLEQTPECKDRNKIISNFDINNGERGRKVRQIKVSKEAKKKAEEVADKCKFNDVNECIRAALCLGMALSITLETA